MSELDARRLERATLSLEGLSLGDALGERFFGAPHEALRRIRARELPPGPWRYTDDSEMAIAVVETLAHHQRIDPDALATTFAQRYRKEPMRGYGGGARDILERFGRGERWQDAAPRVFNGQGSRGNGAAMRVAPLGAYFADDLDRVAPEARASAAVTHAHPDGQAGAVAVALAAAWICRKAMGTPEREGLLAFVHARTPDGATRERLERAVKLDARTTIRDAARLLGTGTDVLSADTVPYALWSAARRLDSFEEAFWTTVEGLGDRDTTCAMACGLVALSVGRAALPKAWIDARERLDLTL